MNRILDNTTLVGRQNNFTINLSRNKFTWFIGTKTLFGYEIEPRNKIFLFNQDTPTASIFWRLGVYFTMDDHQTNKKFKIDYRVIKYKLLLFAAVILLAFIVAGNLRWSFIAVITSLNLGLFLMRLIFFVYLIHRFSK